MRLRFRTILLFLLLVACLGLIAYGIHQGDALLVKDNAAAFCFT
ncbi:MAG: hypothetical protein ACE149_09595 [Armatimonadota bacterium]